MQDRVPTYPGRIKLTPVSGQTNVYDVEMFDEPTVDGTPLNKATFLPDSVVTAIQNTTGVSGITLPADALNALNTALSNLGLTYNAKIQTGSHSGTGTTGGWSITFGFKPYLVIVWRANSQYGMNSGNEYGCIWVKGQTNAGLSTGTFYQTFTLSNSDKTWKITTSASSDKALKTYNVSGETYNYVGVGQK